MGRKSHAYGFRVGVTKNWKSRWFSDKKYGDLALEDLEIRKYLREKLANAGLANIEIERSLASVRIIVHVSRPGVVIGRGGSGAELMRDALSKIAGMKVSLDVVEVKKPDLSATLIAQYVARQIERRRPFRRVMHAAVDKVIGAGAKGVRVVCSGVLGGPSSISRSEEVVEGKVPLQTLRADVDFARETAFTTYGTIGVKVWIYKGEEHAVTKEK